jgi:competence protein ComEC
LFYKVNSVDWNTSSHILGGSWLCFIIGAEYSASVPNVPWIMSILIMTTLAILIFWMAMRITSPLTSLWIGPLLCLSALSGALIERSRIERLNEVLDPQTIMSLTQGKLSGKASVLAVEHRTDGIDGVILIQSYQATDAKERPLKSGLKVRFAIKKKCKGLRHGASIIFRGHLEWIGGQSAPHIKRYQDWLGRRGIQWRLKGMVLLSAEPQQLSFSEAYRYMLIERLNELADTVKLPIGIGLVRGMILGESKALSPELLSRMREMGLGHLFAVSGLHIGVCALLCMVSMRRLSVIIGSTIPKLWGMVGVVCGGWLYTALAGYPLSAQRAMLMLSIWCFTQIMYRGLDRLACLWITAWSLTIYCPSKGQELGLQLSLLATLGLHACLHTSVLEYRFRSHCEQGKTRLKKVLDDLKYGWLTSTRVAFTAWLFTAPALIWHLGELNLVSIMYNTVLTPIISITYIPMALIASLLSPLWDLPLEMMIRLGQVLGQAIIAHPSLSWGTISLAQSFAYPFLAISFAYWFEQYGVGIGMKKWGMRVLLDHRLLVQKKPFNTDDQISRSWQMRCLSIMLLIGVVLFICLFKINTKEAQVTFLYVGQGDATLIRNHEGQYALFDVGPEYGAQALINKLKRYGVYRLEWVAISHLHPDHYGGLPAVAEAIGIDKVLYHGRPLRPLPNRQTQSLPHHFQVEQNKSMISWSTVHERLKSLKIPLQSPSEIVYKTWGGLRLKWILPRVDVPLSENDTSLALLIDGTRERILLSGDLEKRGEEWLRKVWVNAELNTKQLTIWQINHHGSRTSTMRESLSLLKPREAVLSLDGLHRFSFPHPEVVNRLFNHGIRQVRLDLHGDYIIKM